MLGQQQFNLHGDPQLPGRAANYPKGSAVGLRQCCESQSRVCIVPGHFGNGSCLSITAGMAASTSGIPLWRALCLWHCWAVLQQNQLGWDSLSMGTLLSPPVSRAWQGCSPGCCRAQEQLPKELPEEPRRGAAAVAALAQVTEVTGQLAQEQCLWLWQGWRGQQGSGSLATLLQAWGLCSRGDTGEK